jgi:hypothetical protein
MTVPESNKRKDLNSTYRMSVQVSLTGLSFLMEEENRVVFKKYIPFNETKNPDELLFEIEKAFAENEQLKSPVFELVVFYQNTFYAIVPDALFKEDEAEEFLKLNSRVFTTDFVSYDLMENFDLVNVYVPLANINNYFFDHYGEFSYFHFTTTFLEKVLQNEKTGNPKKMHAHIHGHQVDVIVTSGKKLLLCNSFNYSTPEDLTYYILFVAEQLELNPEAFELELSGNISEEDSFFELLYTYIRHVKLETNQASTLRIEK